MNNWEHTSHSNSSLYQINYEDEVVVLQPSVAASLDDIGAVKQLASPQDFRGFRVRFQADVNTGDTDGAGLWLTASHKSWHITDGMYDRLIIGSTDWTHIKLVIDVPVDAEYISYGLWMTGNGVCRMRKPQFARVDKSIAVSTTKIYDRVSSQKWLARIKSF